MSNFKISYSTKKKPLFEKKPKFVNIEYEGEPNIETDSITELTELQKQFREKAKAEAELKEKNTNSEYWSCVVFQNQEQRDQFFELLGVKEADNQYINGKKLIKALELRIETLEQKAPGKFRCNREIAELSIQTI